MLAQVVNERRRLGRPVGWADAQIAATAREPALTLLTCNVRDFEHCGVALLNPWQAVGHAG